MIRIVLDLSLYGVSNCSALINSILDMAAISLPV